jgi:thiol-disulfide isomerase/thioredoxin
MTAQPSCIVVVFGQPDCPACSDYAPRFQAVAQQFPQVPTVLLDINSPQNQDMANRYQLVATPTTLVLRRPVGVIKAEGALDDGEIQQLFALAARG